MNHQYIEDRQVVDRYLMDQLGPDELEPFETHILSCSTCLDELALAENLQKAIKKSLPEHSWEDTEPRINLERIWAVAATVLLSIALAALLWANRELAQERAAYVSLKKELSTAIAPQPIPITHRLAATRSAGSTPAYAVQLSDTPESLLFEIDPGERYKQYNLKLFGVDSVAIWQDMSIAPNSDGLIVVGLHSSWLQEGDHYFEVSPVDDQSVVRRHFRVIEPE